MNLKGSGAFKVFGLTVLLYLTFLLSGQYVKTVVILCCGQARSGKTKFTCTLWRTAGGTGNSAGS